MDFGSTGLQVSERGFGGIPVIRLDMDTAVSVLHRANDREGCVLARLAPMVSVNPWPLTGFEAEP